MKLANLFETKASHSENSDLNKAPPPGNLGDYVTTAQAAKMMKVTQSRIRQFIADGRLKAHHPVKGQRDNMLKKADVAAFMKKPREITGRPDEGKTAAKDKEENA
jgi:excisionase family DNA binding protein